MYSSICFRQLKDEVMNYRMLHLLQSKIFANSDAYHLFKCISAEYFESCKMPLMLAVKNNVALISNVHVLIRHIVMYLTACISIARIISLTFEQTYLILDTSCVELSFALLSKFCIVQNSDCFLMSDLCSSGANTQFCFLLAGKIT